MSVTPKRYRSAGRTETGKVRRHNEDAVLVSEDTGLWVVADGLGGHSAGDHASQLIIERLRALPRPPAIDDYLEAIEDALDDVNTELRRTARQRGVDLICSTVALLVHDAEYLLCGWVGDSRVYGFEDGRLHQITRDHAQGADADFSRGGGRPGGGMLTRAVGADDRLSIDWAVASCRPGAQFLLCSDGVNKEITDRELEAAFRTDVSPPALVDTIFDTALARGARDNVSAIVVRIDL